MNLLFLGGADEIGASAMVVTMAGHKILVDCGIRMGAAKRTDPMPWFARMQEAGGIEIMVITHGHMDHTGAIPVAFQSYPVPIFMTRGTARIMETLLYDSVKIMEYDLGEGGEIPLYPPDVVSRVLSAICPLGFGETVALWGGTVRLTLYAAGHILGASCIVLESDTDGTLMITGDMCATEQLTVDGMKTPPVRPDVLVMESTYGGRLHVSRIAEEQRLVEQASAVIEHNGAGLYPSFAVGRAQELILIFARAMERRELPRVPLLVDGLVREVCSIYRAYPDFVTGWLRRRIAQGDPFFGSGDNIIPVQARDRERHSRRRPALFVASSGGLYRSPSQFYASRIAGESASMIGITGYQDEEAPGRQIQELGRKGGGSLRIGDAIVDLQCQVSTYQLSAHADQSQLVALATALNVPEIVLVHGDDYSRYALATALGSAFGANVHLPALGQELTFRTEARLHVRRQGQGGSWLPKPALSVPRPAVQRRGSVRQQQPLPKLQGKQPMQAIFVSVRNAFPASSGLRSVSGQGATTLVLTFDLPKLAAEQYAGLIAELEKKTGCKITVNDKPYGPAVMAEAEKAVPAEWGRRKNSWIHGKDKYIVVFVEAGTPDLEAIREKMARFEQVTGYRLVIDDSVHIVSLLDLTGEASETAVGAETAYTEIRERFRAEPHQPLRLATKGGHGDSHIEVVFISPQVGERYRALLNELEEATGWRIRIRPTPQQQAIAGAVEKIVPQHWGMRGHPRIVSEHTRVRIQISAAIPQLEIQEIRRAVEAATGYTLVVSF